MITNTGGADDEGLPLSFYLTPDLVDVSRIPLLNFGATGGGGLFSLHDFWYEISGTGISHYPKGTIYRDFIWTAEFGRLDGIHQLGLVGASHNVSDTDHSRGVDSVITATIMDILLYRNKVPEHERMLGIAGGLLHDVAMLPFSEQGKLIKPGSYEEETLLEHVIYGSAKIKALLAKHRIEVYELVATIRGRGIVGSALNSERGIDVDNLSYLAIDQYCAGSKGSAKEGCPKPDAASRALRLGLRKIPGIFDQYNNMNLIDGQWVFDNPRLLTDLLLFRALMYKDIYHNPFNRAKEAFLSRALKGHEVPLDELLTWSDHDFRAWFKGLYGDHEETRFFAPWGPYFQEIGREYDLTKLEDLQAQYDSDTVAVARLKPPRNAATNLVLHRGEVRQLEDIAEFAEDITNVKTIIAGLNYIGIYERVR